MKIILGISAFYHDSAASIIIDGKIIAAAQEERFTRKKHDPSYPSNAIQFVFKSLGPIWIYRLDDWHMKSGPILLKRAGLAVLISWYIQNH